jgi:hypothetical protein
MQRTKEVSGIVCVAVYLILCAVILTAILVLNHGHFSLCLDDPYIHLALAQRISEGHYGINQGEVTAPSSSILWPFLLAPLSRLPWSSWVPLILDLIFGGITAWFIGRFLDRWYFRIDTSRDVAASRVVLALLLAMSANMISLTFIGMEHVLQLLLVTGCALGVLEVYSGRRMPGWSVAMAVLGPAVRYENLALTLAVAIVLWLQGRRRHALVAFASSLAIPVVFGLYLHHHGLAMLPNSVLAKAATYDRSHSPLVNQLFGQIWTLRNFLANPANWPMLATAVGIAWLASKSAPRSLQRAILWTCFCTMVLAGLIGPLGGQFHRYDVYIRFFGLLILFAALSVEFRFQPKFALLFSFVCAAWYFPVTFKLPFASQEIYREQYQMHRFSSEYYKGNVAVNDLGWVSYDAAPGVYVLDLVGLASFETLHQQHKDAAWLDEISQRHDVGLVMIYPHWFTDIPSSWKQVAILSEEPSHVGRFRIYPGIGGNEVSFYATPRADVATLQRQLSAFQKTLPEGVTLMAPSVASGTIHTAGSGGQ